MKAYPLARPMDFVELSQLKPALTKNGSQLKSGFCTCREVLI